jgi:hypothetical protein
MKVSEPPMVYPIQRKIDHFTQCNERCCWRSKLKYLFIILPIPCSYEYWYKSKQDRFQRLWKECLVLWLLICVKYIIFVFLYWPGVDFIEQFMPYAWNLRSEPIFFHKFTLTWHHAFALLAQFIAFSPTFVCALGFTPYAQLLWNLPLVLYLSLLNVAYQVTSWGLVFLMFFVRSVTLEILKREKLKLALSSISYFFI